MMKIVVEFQKNRCRIFDENFVEFQTNRRRILDDKVVKFQTNMFIAKPMRRKVKNLMTLQDDKKNQNIQYFSSLQSEKNVLYDICHHILGSNPIVIQRKSTFHKKANKSNIR